jgi:hypothetical protein
MMELNTSKLLLVTEWVYASEMGHRTGGDGWEYQRGWYLSRGSSSFQAMLDNADVIADLFTNLEDFLGGEAIEYTANYAYHCATGRRDAPQELYEPSLVESWPDRWLANDIDAETLRRHYPRMWRRFGDPEFARLRHK